MISTYKIKTTIVTHGILRSEMMLKRGGFINGVSTHLKMKNTTLLILLSILTFSACGQTKIDCNEIRNDKPYFADYKPGKMDSLISLDLQIIGNCIELDSIDKKFFLNPQVLAVQMLQLTNDKKEVNYGNIIDYIAEFKSTEQYKKGRLAFEFTLKYENKVVNRADSVQVRQNFQNMGFSDSNLNEMMTVVYSDKNSNLTYKEAFAEFIQSKEPKKKPQPTKNPDLLFGHFKEIDNLNQLKENNSGKTTLIYFSGWGDINSRKMEEAFFNEQEIQNLFGEYSCFIGYVDDRSAIKPEQQKQFPTVPMKTKGQFINEIEKSLFPKAYQPVILIVDSNFKLVNAYSYNKEKQDFIEFLERNKDVR
jgi:hypothetical protein